MTIDERLAGLRTLPTDERLAQVDAAVFARLRAERAQAGALPPGLLGLAGLVSLMIGLAGAGAGGASGAPVPAQAEIGLGVPAALASSSLLGTLE